MFFPTKKIEIYLYTKRIDGRWGVDRLAHMCASEMGFEPRSGKLFVFFNKSLTRAKIYFYDGSGSCLYLKRLEKGTFKIPCSAAGQMSLSIEPSKLALLLEGADVETIRKPKPWSPKRTTDNHLIY